MTKFNDDELAGLSDAEREALLAEDDDDAGTTANDDEHDQVQDTTGAAASGEDGANKNDLAAATPDEEADRATASEPQADHSDPAEEPAAGSEPRAQHEPFAPRYEAALPEDFKEQMQAIDDQVAALETKYRDAEMTFEEFRIEERKLESERQKLNDARIKAEIASESNEQAERQRWQWEVQHFMRDVKKREGIDYGADETLLSDLDAFLRALGQNPANEQREAEWFLSEAHRRVKVLRGIAPTVAAPADNKLDLKKAVADERRQERPKQTLAELPAASREDATLGEGEFAYLEQLTGEKLERAIAKLTPEQAARYLDED